VSSCIISVGNIIFHVFKYLTKNTGLATEHGLRWRTPGFLLLPIKLHLNSIKTKEIFFFIKFVHFLLPHYGVGWLSIDDLVA